MLSVVAVRDWYACVGVGFRLRHRGKTAAAHVKSTRQISAAEFATGRRPVPGAGAGYQSISSMLTDLDRRPGVQRPGRWTDDIAPAGQHSAARHGGSSFTTAQAAMQGQPCADLAQHDPETIDSWIFPTNYEVREYQRSIVESALFRNTMVTLPTGLGKTFIGAVVMYVLATCWRVCHSVSSRGGGWNRYNFYRWFPRGQVIFMAPTRPLVTQQLTACYSIVGMPEHDTAMLQGNVPASKRAHLWRERRVFFCTPQTMVNDMKRGLVDLKRVVCLVVDEAHRAAGNYACVACCMWCDPPLSAPSHVLRRLLCTHVQVLRCRERAAALPHAVPCVGVVSNTRQGPRQDPRRDQQLDDLPPGSERR